MLVAVQLVFKVWIGGILDEQVDAAMAVAACQRVRIGTPQLDREVVLRDRITRHGEQHVAAGVRCWVLRQQLPRWLVQAAGNRLAKRGC